jgi:hypothetical protein
MAAFFFHIPAEPLKDILVDYLLETLYLCTVVILTQASVAVIRFTVGHRPNFAESLMPPGQW